MKLSNYSKKKDSETININNATPVWIKKNKNVTFWFFPTKEAKETASLILTKETEEVFVHWEWFATSAIKIDSFAKLFLQNTLL